MPEVGEIGGEIAFVKWLKADGDPIQEGEPLYEVDTAKAVVQIDAFASGTLAGIRVAPGDMVKPHQVVAVLLAPGEVLAPVPRDARAGRVQATPKARLLAAERGIELAEVPAGSGAGGLVTERDVQALAIARTSGPADPGEPGREKSARRDRVRKAVADSTAESWRTIPHFYLTLEADLTQGLGRAKPLALVCAAVANSLARHPELNLAWHGERLIPRDSIDLGILVDTAQGLLLPVIRNAATLSLDAMQGAVQAAVNRATNGQLRPDDYGPRSISVSNLGMFPVDRFSGVIPAPDVMLLACGRVRTAPYWEGDRWEPRRVADLTLSVDHRAIDGADAARFLGTLESALANAGELA